MSNVNWIERGEIAKQWVLEAAEHIKKALASKIHVEAKSNPDDLVTDVDRSTEAFFYEKVSTHFPSHHFLGEEGISENVEQMDGTVWIIDPIDGTMNFVHSQFKFAISLAVYHEGIGKIGIIYDVMAGELFQAIEGQGAFLNGKPVQKITERPLEESILGLNARWIVEDRNPYRRELAQLVRDVRGIRSYGSAALELAYVASNRLDGYISVKLSPWDYAAGIIILKETGCCVTNFNGESLSLLKGGSVFAGKPAFHKEVIKRYVGRER
ncbi:inositol monophosphatase family protein [Halalkalibacterium ligniniphilum]|uniref:inositol monophosphatase family protein n=1 Tax=Halalkalibacterium ligniniphilum TaxID=1134413 RepID=UPI000346A109|nr:inositol monophosphatase family protein [Halalkalibacterium ligniniphilum]